MTSAAVQPPQAPPLPITREIYEDLKARYDPLCDGMIDRMVREGKYRIIDDEPNKNKKVDDGSNNYRKKQ